MERRNFLAYSGAATLVGMGEAQAGQTVQPDTVKGRSIADFNVEPRVNIDQSAVFQKAIDAIAADDQPIFIPPGVYHVSNIRLPSHSALFGIAGFSILDASGKGTILNALDADKIHIENLILHNAGRDDAGTAALNCRGVEKASRPSQSQISLTINHVEIVNAQGDGVSMSTIKSQIFGLNARDCVGVGVKATKQQGLSVSHSKFRNCRQGAIATLDDHGPVAQISENHFDQCGIHIEGNVMISQNIFAGGDVAIKLGNHDRLGYASVTNNMIQDVDIGIGISNAPQGYAMITMNMIVGAKNGGIRAFDGNNLIGKDLTKGGSEAFRYIAVGGNVSV